MAKSGLFYLIVNPGLESVAKLELFEAWLQAPAFFSLESLPEVRVSKGGLEFRAPLDFGFFLNRVLKIPNRILLRLKTFDADHESKLIKGLSEMEWGEWLKKGSPYQLQFTSKSSRLSYKRQAEQILQKILKGHKQSKEEGPLFQIRIFRDQCTLSLDTTGERAQFRGEGKKVSRAPLRDNLAAGLLRILLQGLDGDIELIDPMCGSGTFLIEALSMGSLSSRRFAFEDFPVSQNFPEMESKSQNSKIRGVGFDKDPAALEPARQNLKNFSSQSYQVELGDLFAKDSYPAPMTTRVVVVNPPWGKRLKIENKNFLQAIDQKFQPQRIGMLVPAKWSYKDISMEKVKDVLVLNSGLENRFLLFAR